MKRAALFLLLLAAGLFTLRLFDGGSFPFLTQEEPAPEEPPAVQPAADETPEVDVQPSVTPDDHEVKPEILVGLTPSGRFHSVRYHETDAERDPRWFEMESEDSGRAADDPAVLELIKFSATLYDYAEGKDNPERLIVTGDRGSVREASRNELEVEYGNIFELEQVHAVILDGAPIVPLDLLSPRATVDVTKQQEIIRSSTKVTLTGDGIDIRGLGYELELSNKKLRINQDASLRLDLTDQPVTELRSDGPLVLSRDDDSLVATASENASIKVPGTEGGLLEAGSITLVGRNVDGKTIIQRLEATNGVVWHFGDQTFSGNHLVITFHRDLDKQNKPEKAVLQGTPVAQLLLDADPVDQLGSGEAKPLESDTPKIRLTVSCNDSLRVAFLDNRTEFRADGPAIVETSEGTMRSVGDVTAWEDDRRGAGFKAETAVVLESEGGEQMLANAIEGRFEKVGDEYHIRFYGKGNVQLERNLEDGVRVLLSSADGLDVESAGDSWRLIEGRFITIVREAPEETFTATADRVWDAELAGPKFRAEGNVRVTNVDADGNNQLLGSSVHFQGKESYRLQGTVEQPAQLLGNFGSIEAVSLEREGNMITAEGGIKGLLLGDELNGRLDISTDKLALTQGAHARVRTWKFTANGSVIADWTSLDGREETYIDCDLLIGSRVEQLDVDERTYLSAVNDWNATGVRESRLEMEGGKAWFESDRLLMRTRERRDGVLKPADEAPDEFVDARGNVWFKVQTRNAGAENSTFEGRGNQLTLDGLKNGQLLPLEGQQVWASGGLRADNVPYQLWASQLTFREDGIDAQNPVLELNGIELTGERTTDANASSIKITANEMVATPNHLELKHNVLAKGDLRNGKSWDFRCQRIRFKVRDPKQSLTAEGLQSMYASGDVRFGMYSSLGPFLKRPVATATGARLRCEAGLRTLRLEGSPAEIVTPAFRTSSSSYLEFDPEIAMLIGAGPGFMEPGSATPDANWKLKFHSSRTLEDAGTGSYITALQEPVLEDPESDTLLRSSWLVLWLDANVWNKMPDRMLIRTADSEEDDDLFADDMGEVPDSSNFQKNQLLGGMLNFLGDLGAGDLLKEAYFEGPINALYKGSQVASIGAFYLDMQTGRGWLHEPTLSIYGPMVGQEFERLIVRSKWMRYTEDGALHASDATVTPCAHEESHLRIVTGDMTIRPEGEELFEVSLRDNRIELYDSFTIPLFPITYASKDGYTPLWKTISFGNSARFGTSASAGFEAPGGAAGDLVQELTGADPDTFKSKWKVDASWLGSRGVLLDFGFLAEAQGLFWSEAYVGGLPDSGSDRGYIRIPENERSTLRLWSRLKSRFFLGDKTSVDVRVSTQTDAGVQSEFYEDKIESYEERDTFAHLRSSRGPWYLDATVKTRIDDDRTEIEELPSGGLFRGRERIGAVKGLDLFHTGSLRAEFLKRVEGAAGLQSPFALPDTFADGFGNQEVARVLTDQRFEMPLPLVLGLQLTPFVNFSFRGWNEDRNGVEAHRSLLSVGGRLSGSYWRQSDETLSQFGPYIEFSKEIDASRKGDPFFFDRFDNEFDGDVIRAGTYGRISSLDGSRSFEVDISTAHIADRTNEATHWLPAQVFTRLEVEPFGMPVELWHDATYDLDNDTTRYSLTSFAFRPKSDLRFELGHRRARTEAGPRLYEAAVFGGVWRANEKWEFEGQQTVSLQSNQDLDSNFILRRFGHDIVFEVEYKVREGEGSSISFSIEPSFGWKDSGVGFVRY